MAIKIEKSLYDIPAKSTRYNGIRFRSRLEAKWAVFFDLVGWEYVYEPSEIEGYNPDFILKCKSSDYKTNVCVVEVKPQVFLTDEIIQSVCEKYKNLKAHILILSDFPFTNSSDYGGVLLGIGCQYYPYIDAPNHTDCSEIFMKTRNDFASQLMIWDGMIHGKCDRKYFMDSAQEREDIKVLWANAGNKVQFKIRRKNG